MTLTPTNTFLVTSNVHATALTSPSFTPATNDILVVKGTFEDSSATLNTPTATGGGITWTLRQSDTSASHTGGWLWTGVVTTGGTALTVSCTTGGASNVNGHAMLVEQWSGASCQLAAAPASTKAVGAGTATASLTTAAAGSVVSWLDGDWAALSPASATYANSATSEGIDNKSPNNYVAYFNYQQAATAGANTFGVTSPTGQTYSLLAVEIQAKSGSTPTVTGATPVSVGLTGAATVLAVAAGSLALGLALTGTAVPVAVATGTLPVVAGLTGTASSAATVTGALPASVALTGTASQAGTYTATGALPAALSLTGAASMVATVTGSLPLTAGLSGTGSVVGSYVTTGNLPLTVALAGTGQTITTVTGAVPVAVGLTGSANVPAVPALTGTLPTALSLTGAANIVALTTGTLPVSVALSGVGVNPSNEHDITVTAALDPRPWASALTTRTNTGLLVQRSWEARLE